MQMKIVVCFRSSCESVSPLYRLKWMVGTSSQTTLFRTWSMWGGDNDGVYWQYINSIHSRSIKKNDKYKVWIYSLRFCTKILKPFVKLTKESEKLKSFIAAVMNLEVSDEEPLLQERVWHLLCLFCLLKISPLCFNVYVDSLGHCKK